MKEEQNNMKSFQDIISFSSLYRANQLAKKGKMSKKEVIDFQNELGSHLWEIHYELYYHHYKIESYRKFKIYDPKEREIQAISYKDRIIQHSLCDNYLIPCVSKHLVYDNVACRKGKGTSLAIHRVRKFMKEYYEKNSLHGYFIKLDISKFFDSIDHDILKEKIKEISIEEEINRLLFMIIDSYEKTPSKGLPMGNQTSQFFALLYLNDLDHYIKEKLHVKYYVRYMDDMFLIVSSKEEASLILFSIQEFLVSFQLHLNHKSQIIPLKNGIEWIGFRFFYGLHGKIIQKVKQQTKRRILKKIRTKRQKTKEEEKAAYASYFGFLKRSNTFYLTKRIKEILIQTSY